MKICGIICEFNPFHNGHEYLIKRVRELYQCDYIVCIMSGSFSQRGDVCVADKYVRAKHAVLSGADCVLELPAPFAVAPAEIFARGAVKILLSVPDIEAIAFGCESGISDDFKNTAVALSEESEEFKKHLKSRLNKGESYVKSYAYAIEMTGGNAELVSSPNNVLGLEYAKAVLKQNKKIRLLPIKRAGADYNDSELKENFSSASAIRKNFSSPLVKSNVPPFVYKDLDDFSTEEEKFEDSLRLLLSRTPKEILQKIYGCGEGLENALKNLQDLPFKEIIEKATSKRYSSSRIKRILCANFLNLYSEDCESYLNSDLYLSPLAVKKSSADGVFKALAQSSYPLLTSGSDEQKLNEIAQKCKKSDDFSYSQWRQLTGKQPNKMIII